MSRPRAVLIGIGNPYRRDDGIGPALAAEIEQLRPPGVSVTVSDGEPTWLLDAWSGAPLAVVVDAVLCDDPGPAGSTAQPWTRRPPGPPQQAKRLGQHPRAGHPGRDPAR